MVPRYKNLLIVSGIALMALSVCPPVAAGMTALEILKKADEARGGNLDGVGWQMTIDSVEKGRPRQRTLEVTLRGRDALVEFSAPADAKGMKFLIKDRRMWFIKSDLSRPVAISARQKLAGGAAGGDIAATDYAADYRVTNESEEVLDGEPCFVYDLSAVGKWATYDRIRYWISRKRLVGLKAEFYTVSGKLFKSASFEYENRLLVQGQNRPFISKATIKSVLMKDDVTVITYRRPALRKVPDAVFHLDAPAKQPEEKDDR